FIILISFIIATILNFFNLDMSLNKIGTKLGELELIHIYANNNLNGLISLGILLAIISFIYDMLLKNKENK
ncbi:hypothetical protein, partial [Staphylococcus gallinarum]|uniref:hypothetical protein n=2 Tax=Staphylococcus gallinarum TaxID=1293 RepID=UPI000E6903C7